MTDLLSNVVEFSVSELSLAVRKTIEGTFDYVRVRGEISGFRGQHGSGHAYFTLKDADASLDAVVWKMTWPRLQFKPSEGLEVIATGRLTTFPRSSKYQLVIDQLQPAGAGALMVLLEERRRKLAAEGLFDPARKRPLPYMPRVIGVITSPTGAVIRDILHRFADRFPRHIVVWPVRVQGETCAAEVSAALAGFNAMRPGGPVARPDVIIVARGGGSIEDLWGFNEEAVVRAVAASAIPVISAVGHETDTTLIDHVADARAPTPTAAAEIAIPVRADLVAFVRGLGERLRNGLGRASAGARDRLRAASAGLPRAEDLTGRPQQALDRAAARLTVSLRHLGQRKRIDFGEVAPRFALRLLTGRAGTLRVRLTELDRRQGAAMARATERRRAAFAGVAQRLSPNALALELRHARARLTPLSRRLVPAVANILGRQAARLEALDRLLDSFSYRSVLERGFALVTDAGRNVLRTTAEATPGKALTVEVADGTFGASVGGAPVVRRRRIRRPGDDDGQTSLF